MLTYVLQHHAHHRGQIRMVARDLDHVFAGDDGMRILEALFNSQNKSPRKDATSIPATFLRVTVAV